MELSIQNLRRQLSHLRKFCFAMVTSLLLSNLIPLADTGILCMPNCGENGGIYKMNPDGKQLRRFTNILNTKGPLLLT